MSEDDKKNEVLDIEKDILTIFRRVLANDALTVDDDFFEAGGDSLLAMDLLLEVEAFVGKLLPSTIIFETGTVRELVKILVKSDHSESVIG
jgi:acyl carrier protein